MNGIDDVKQAVIEMRATAEQRYLQHDDLLRKLAESVEKMASAISKLDVFHSELNHTNNEVSEVRRMVKENSDDIESIHLTQVSNQTIIDELKRWRLWILSAIGGLIVTYIGSQFLTPKIDPVQQSMIETLKELKEEN